MRYIYVLKDPKTLEIKYVGQTNNVDRRYRDHIRRSLKEDDEEYNTYKSRWIRKIINLGLKPLVEVIDECQSYEESNEKENKWVAHFYESGSQLTNSHSTDVTEHSQETRKKISSSRKGKRLEEIVGEEKASELRNYYSERMKIHNPNKSSDDIVRGKISDTLKEYFSNPENHWAYGLKMTDEHNEKLRQAKLNNPKNVGNRLPKTEEQKEKIRKSILGRKVERHKILQYDLDGNLISEWKSLREIERHDSTLKRSQISKCCKGEKDFYAGFIWKYKTNI
jgi:hypothetical protein